MGSLAAGTVCKGEPILQGFIPATGQPITVKLTNYGMGGPWHMRLFPEDSGGGSGGGGGVEAEEAEVEARVGYMYCE
jgi:hypothetical protein